MALNYDNTLKDARMTQIITALNSGTLEICTSGYSTVLAVFTFSATSGSTTNGVLTLSFTATSVAASAGGTAALARCKNNGASRVVINNLAVGTSGSDINLNTTTITSGQTITITGSAQLTHAP